MNFHNTHTRLKGRLLLVSCSFHPSVSEWLPSDGFTHMKDFALMCHTLPTRSAKQLQSLPLACRRTNVFIHRPIVRACAPFCLSSKCCKQVLTCQPTRCHMPLCHDLPNSCAQPLCAWACVGASVWENVFTVRVINGCKRSFSPRFCAKPRPNKEKE